MAKNLHNNYRYRLTYSRKDAMAWLAHLDLMRNFQYSCRRAELPMAYTKGYNPRPIMEFALPVGVGIETRQDPLDIELQEQVAPNQIKEKLNTNFPPGLTIESVRYLDYPVKSLMSLVKSAVYTIKADNIGIASEKAILQTNDSLIVKRIRKGKIRQYNLRELILDLKIIGKHEIEFLCKAGSSSNLRPDMLLKALVEAKKITKNTALDAIIIRNRVYLNTED